jgi:hypothetical protein
MLRITVCLLTALCSFAADWKSVTGSAVEEPASMAGSATGDRVLAVRTVTVEGIDVRGKPSNGELLIFLDQITGFYYWLFWDREGRTTRHDPAAQIRDFDSVYVTDDRMVVFQGGLASYFVSESSRRAQSLDAAMAATLKELPQYIGEISNESYMARTHKSRALRLRPAIADEVFFPGGMSAMSKPVKFLKASREKDQWVLLLESALKAKVVLNDKFEVVTWEKVP